VDKNIKYARKCVRDSLNKGEAPIASHLLYTQPGILDDDVPEERQWGIDAGLAWRKDSEATIVYIDLGITRGMEYGITDAKENNRPIEYRSIDNVIKYNHHGADVLVKKELKGKHADFCLCYQCKKFHPGDSNNCPISNDVYQNCVKYNNKEKLMHQEYQYLNIMQKIIDEGKRNENRTGVATKRLLCEVMKFDLSEEFPLLTTKKVYWKGVLHELLWFLSGDTNIKYLQDNGVHIWDANAKDYWEKVIKPLKEQEKEKRKKHPLATVDAHPWFESMEEGDLGPVYGAQWRNFNGWHQQGFDQIKWAENEIRNNPESRRIIVSAWNLHEIPMMALPPCHCFFKLTVDGDTLHCTVYIRSNDFLLGSPFNIASYALLTCMFASTSDLKPGNLNYIADDCHLYENHFEQAETQLKRKPYSFPKIKINKRDSILDITANDIELIGYKSHAAIKAPLAV